MRNGHEIRASGTCEFALAAPDEFGDFGEMQIQEARIDRSSFRCVCGEEFKDGDEAADHLAEVLGFDR